MMAWAKLKLAAMAVAAVTVGTAVAIAIAVVAQAQDIAPAQMPALVPIAAATAEARALTLVPPKTMPTGNQLLALMEASRTRYRSMDMEYSVSISERDIKFTETNDDVWRWAKDHEYYHADEVGNEDGRATTSSVTVVAAGTWSKKFETSSENGPEGIVMRGNELMQATDSNPFKAMELGIAPGDVPAKWDPKTGFLEFESRLVRGTKVGPTSVWASTDVIDKVTVDPSRGFVPVRFERSKPDGPVQTTRAFEDYREVEQGLWMPWKVTTDFASSNLHVYTIKRVKINGEISAEKLDFEFPPEANVDDQISGQVHSGAVDGVPEVAQALAMTQPGSTVRPGQNGIDPRAAVGAEAISGTVRKITAFPSPIILGRFVPGETISQVIVVEPFGVKDPHDVKMVPSVDWIKVTLDENSSSISRVRNAASLRDPGVRMTEAQIADAVEPKWYLQYLVEATPPASFSLAGVKSAADLPYYIEVQAGAKDKWMRVPVVGELLPAIEVEPATVLLESGKTEYRVSVRRNGQGAWKLKGFSTKGDDVAVQSITPEPDGRQLLIKVAALKPGFVQGQLMLEMEGETAPVEIGLVGLINK